jgi:hypothetical protein
VLYKIQIFVPPSTSPQHDNHAVYDDTTIEFLRDKKQQKETAVEKILQQITVYGEKTIIFIKRNRFHDSFKAGTLKNYTS